MIQSKFNTILEVLADARCQRYIREQVADIHRKRDKLATKGGLKSNVFLRLASRSMLTTRSLVDEFLKIDNKISTLPAAERLFIADIVTRAMTKTVQFYNAHPELENIQETIPGGKPVGPKLPRTKKQESCQKQKV